MITASNQTFTEELYRINPARTVVILEKPWSELTSEEKGQLYKISGALKQRISPALSVDAFQVVHQSQLDVNQLVHKPNEIIYFGSPIKGLAYYEVIEANGIRMVLSESLRDLIPNDQSRQKLWKALQQLFVA